jgi:hypothetical protein
LARSNAAGEINRLSVPPLCLQDATGLKLHEEKPSKGGAPNSTPMIVDHTTIDIRFVFRRYAMNPTAAKPRSIIAHVEGSGTALAITRASGGASMATFQMEIEGPVKA